MELCRDSVGNLNVSTFTLWTCTMCYHYLFQDNKKFISNMDVQRPRLNYNPEYKNETNFGIIANSSQKSVRTMVCSDLSDRECSDWRSCCSEAEVCCERQKKQQKVADVISCPSTWDGYGCFMETLGGSVAEIGCPSYVKHRKTSGIYRRYI